MAVSQLPRKARATLNDVIDHIQELHSCLHNVDEKVGHVKVEVAKTNERVARIEGYQQGVASKLGVPAEGEKAPNFWRRHKNPLVLAGAVFAGASTFAAGYPLLRTLIVAVFQAADAYLMKAG